MEEHANNLRLSTLVADLEQCAKQGDRRQPEVLTLIRDVAVEIGRAPDLLHELERRANLVSSLCQPDSQYTAFKLEAFANLPSRTEATNPAILADLESLSRQAESGLQSPQYLEQVLSEREMLERLLKDQVAELIYNEKLEKDAWIDPPSALVWKEKDCWESWLTTCKAIEHETKPLGVDGCRILYHVYLDETGQPEDNTAEILTMVDDPSLALFLSDIVRAAEALLADDSGSSGTEPLTDDQQAVFDYIRRNGPVMGTKIVSDCGLSSESSLTSHIIPALKRHRGVKNKAKAGYYVPR